MKIIPSVNTVNYSPKSYSRQWKNDKINGKGEYIFADGGQLKGTFKNNVFNKGKYTLTQNDVTYKYNIKKGLLTNQIEIAYANHGNYKGTYEAIQITRKATSRNKY